MDLKNEEKASTAASLTYARLVSGANRRFQKRPHVNILVLKTFRKDFLNRCLMLGLDYTWSRSKNSECALSLTSVS